MVVFMAIYSSREIVHRSSNNTLDWWVNIMTFVSGSVDHYRWSSSTRSELLHFGCDHYTIREDSPETVINYFQINLFDGPNMATLSVRQHRRVTGRSAPRGGIEWIDDSCRSHNYHRMVLCDWNGVDLPGDLEVESGGVDHHSNAMYGSDTNKLMRGRCDADDKITRSSCDSAGWPYITVVTVWDCNLLTTSSSFWKYVFFPIKPLLHNTHSVWCRRSNSCGASS